MIKTRACGVLLPVSSLPSPYGIGCFSREAYEFVDFLSEAGQTYWQILPLGPTGFGDSPYQSFSTFAGNPYFIDLEALIEEGLLTRKECEAADFGSKKQHIEYGKLYESRFPLLKKAFLRAEPEKEEAYQAFRKENDWWLTDYAMYMSIKKIFNNQDWSAWAEDIRLRYGYSMDYYWNTCQEDIRFYQFLQYKFWQQWSKLKKYANDKGIKIIGDLPIYVAYDSSDAWAHPDLFQFDEKNNPKAVAGCPPDAFTADGQLWGNPLYDWTRQKNTGYAWWISRFRYISKLYDVVRIDHFRGFDEYFSIPYGDKNARGGHWEKGPGTDLFDRVQKELPELEVIAEDLGFITDSVRELVRKTGFPNMRVLEFGWDVNGDNEHMPHNFDPNCAVYTGTHDNSMLKSWYETLGSGEVKLASRYLDKDLSALTPEKRNWAFIRLLMYSCARTCIIPIQDYLCLDDSARINTPSTVGTNWTWRMGSRMLTKKLQKEILAMTEESYRLSNYQKHQRWLQKEAARKAAEEKAAAKAAAAKEPEKKQH